MNLNSVQLAGRVGKDPDLSYTQSGKAVCKFSLATSFKYNDSSGTKQEKVTWHNIVIWGKLAEITKEYLNKGDIVLLEGTIDNRSYDDQAGAKKYISEVIVKNIQFGPKNSSKETDLPHDKPSSEGVHEYEGELPF